MHKINLIILTVSGFIVELFKGNSEQLKSLTTEDLFIKKQTDENGKAEFDEIETGKDYTVRLFQASEKDVNGKSTEQLIYQFDVAIGTQVEDKFEIDMKIIPGYNDTEKDENNSAESKDVTIPEEALNHTEDTQTNPDEKVQPGIQEEKPNIAR